MVRFQQVVHAKKEDHFFTVVSECNDHVWIHRHVRSDRHTLAFTQDAIETKHISTA